MILGIGVDTIEIERFIVWHTYSHKRLRRIFSQEEINYCLSDITLSSQRFAVRFAAREALYKALSYAFPDIKIPFLTLCSCVNIATINSRPYFVIHKDFMIDLSNVILHLSLSHSRTIATAFVVIEQ